MLRPTLRPHADQTPAQAGPSAPTNPAPIAAPSLTTMPPTYPFPHQRGNGIRAECRFATVVLAFEPLGMTQPCFPEALERPEVSRVFAFRPNPSDQRRLLQVMDALQRRYGIPEPIATGRGPVSAADCRRAACQS